MNNFNSAFTHGKAFIPFFVCGDPSLDATAAAVRAAVNAGADIVELNIPFSDPTAGDAAIQEANIRALSAGTTTDKIFDLIRALRRDITVPFVISGYANVVFSYGAERFLKTCAEIGVEGLIVPDLPFEEREEFLDDCRRFGIDLIYMIAITSNERVAMIAKEATGFLYIMATPGTREQELTDMMAQVRQTTAVPCVVCLNGTELERYPAVAARTDGVVMDAPFVQIVAAHGENAHGPIAEYVKATKMVLNFK